MSEEIKQLLEQQGKAFEEFKTANDARLKAIEEKGYAPADLEEQVERLSQALTDQKKEIEDIATDILKKANRPAPGSDADPVKAEHKAALMKWIRKGEEGNLRELEKKAMIVGSDPGGGYLVGSEMEAGVDTIAKATVAMMGLADVRTTGSSTYKRRVRTSGAGYGWVGEEEEPSETTTPSYAVLEFKPGTIYAEPQISQEMLEDGEVDAEAEIMDALSEDLPEGIGEALVTGSGINKPRGLLSYTTVANESYAWGSLGYIASGNAGALPDDFDEFIDVVHALKPKYRINGQWLLNDLTLSSIRKYKDGDGNYIWQPSLQMGVPDRFLGYPLNTDDNMPDVSSNTLSIAFGDFKKGYIVVRRRGMAMLRDPYTAKPFTKFYTTIRIGGGIKHYEAIKFMKMAAS